MLGEITKQLSFQFTKHFYVWYLIIKESNAVLRPILHNTKNHCVKRFTHLSYFKDNIEIFNINVYYNF